MEHLQMTRQWCADSGTGVRLPYKDGGAFSILFANGIWSSLQRRLQGRRWNQKN